jgi:hypothetical protein
MTPSQPEGSQKHDVQGNKDPREYCGCDCNSVIDGVAADPVAVNLELVTDRNHDKAQQEHGQKVYDFPSSLFSVAYGAQVL